MEKKTLSLQIDTDFKITSLTLRQQADDTRMQYYTAIEKRLM